MESEGKCGQTGLDAAGIVGMAWQYRASRVLHAANAFDVFTKLSGNPATAGELAGRCGAKPDMLEKLLIACAALGLLAKDGERYVNTDAAENYLVRGRPQYQGDMIAHTANLWSFWNRLPDEVRRADVPAPDQQWHRHFILAMRDGAMAGRARDVSEVVDLRGRRQLFDLGGGPGSFSIAFCRKYPVLRAIVFDLPETAAIARQVIEAEGMQDRVSVREGDWNADDFGAGNDVVLMSNVLHGAGSAADMKLAKAFASMTPGGLLIVQDFLLNDEKTGPVVSALFNVRVGAFSRAEMLAAIGKAGFADAAVVWEQDKPGSAVITARKPQE